MATRELVEAPARGTRRGGIKDVASFVNNDRIGATDLVSFLSDGCTFPLPAIGLCYGEVVAEEKTSTGIDIIDGLPPFALYAGVECYIAPDSDNAERARSLLEQGEDRPLEQKVMEWANGGAPLVAGTSVTAAIANVEQAMDQQYPGVGVIMLSRGDAVLAGAQGSIETSADGKLTTVLGTPVIASGWLPRGTAYGVGAITVLKSDVASVDTIDHRTNREWSVAEAVYSIIIDCAFRVHAAFTDSGGGAQGVGIESVNDLGAGEFNFTLTDGTNTDPVQAPAGPQGDTGPQGDPGIVQAVVAGTGITVDSTDPASPIVSAAA